MPQKCRPLILVILDGFGINRDARANAVALAQTPQLDRIYRAYPHTELEASQSHVGLPAGFMGNSEVGHLNIGAGRVVYQDFSLISRAIETGDFFENPVLLRLVDDTSLAGKAVHLMGLVSDGGVHSHTSHLVASIDLCKRRGVSKLWIHAITDGRDTDPRSGLSFIHQVERCVSKQGIGRIATVSGRFYAMDRDTRWERTQKAYECIVQGTGPSFETAEALIASAYSTTGDEFIVPAKVAPYEGMADGDGVIFFNFRADRARQLTAAMTCENFSGFARGAFFHLGFVCMTPYDASLSLAYAYDKPRVHRTLGEIVSLNGWRQLRIAETEKYAHVTYFFNGGCEVEFPGEKRVLVPSPRDVKTYDQRPQMSARELTQRLLAELESPYEFVVVNFANADMVGHTGNLPAAVKAVEVVDECVGRIVQWIETHGALGIITADHGNCERMANTDGTVLTAHTLLPVPFIVVDPLRNIRVLSGGRLCDIAPSVLSLWAIQPPSEMTGRSLLVIESPKAWSYPATSRTS